MQMGFPLLIESVLVYFPSSCTNKIVFIVYSRYFKPAGMDGLKALSFGEPGAVRAANHHLSAAERRLRGGV